MLIISPMIRFEMLTQKGLIDNIINYFYIISNIIIYDSFEVNKKIFI